MGALSFLASADVDAPAEVVWSLVADHRRDPEWRHGVLEMTTTATGDVAEAGAVTVERIRVAGKVWRNVGTVVDVDPGAFRLTWRTTEGADAHGSRAVERIDGDRCRLHLELHVTPHGAERLLVPVLRRTLRDGLAGDVQRAAALVTGRSVQPAP